jgi:membrane fusion protein, multidrug efflux system
MADGTSMSRPASDTPVTGPEAPTRLDQVREARRTSPETEPAKPEAAPSASPERTAAKRPRRRLLRPLLFALLPVALAGAAYVYVTGGQVMETDNAYVEADRVGISTDVAGTVASVDVHNNEAVTKGQVLFRLKQESFKIALAGAEAQLGTVRNQVLTLKASYQQSLAQIAQAESDIPFYEATFKRQQDLARSAAASQAAFDQAKQDLNAAHQKVEVAKAQAAAMLAQLGNDPDQPLEQNPFYLQAKSGVDNAERDLADTVVKAPFDGIVTNVDALQVGSYLKSAQAAFSLVSATNVWVAASPKETELTYVKPGQPATITVDTYPGVTFKGTVGSISPASGASFSLLPAQNTTGNWVKVVQRIPMIVKFDDLSGKPPLRVGMSATVEVDTSHARGIPMFVTDLLDRLGLGRHG